MKNKNKNLIQPAAAEGTRGSSGPAEGADCGGKAWIHHLLCHPKSSTM